MTNTLYSKHEVLALVRHELEITNLALGNKPVIGGLTDSDLQTIAIISLALREEKEVITNQIAIEL